MQTTRRGPIEGEHVIGIDADPASRPGVPKHGKPRESVSAEGRPMTEQSEGRGEKLERAGLDSPTVVFGTAQPPRGVSGVLRRVAYDIPEHYARHWMLLLLADRVDVLEDRLGEVMARPLEARGNHDAAARVRGNPAPILAAGLVGFWLTKKLL